MLFSLYHVSQLLPPSVYVCAGVTCQNWHSLDMSCPIFTHLSTPAGTRQRKPVCGTENLYAYTTLLSTIFTLAEFMFVMQQPFYIVVTDEQNKVCKYICVVFEKSINSIALVLVCGCMNVELIKYVLHREWILKQGWRPVVVRWYKYWLANPHVDRWGTGHCHK